MSLPPSTENALPDEARDALDRSLLQRMAAGDQAALGALYDRFSRPLYSVAFQVINDAAEAEDIVHDVFMTLWQKAGDYSADRGRAFAWALTLTRNRAIDRLRSRRRRRELIDNAAPADLGYDETLSSNDSADDLWLNEKKVEVRQAVSALPADQRKALELAYFSGLTQQEIAAKLSEPLGTIKARMRRGLFKLRDLLASRL